MDVDPQRFIAHPLTAGVGGAIVGLRFAPGGTWIERLGNTIAGVSCAWWISPALSEILVLTSPAQVSALSFAIGMFGMSLVAAILEAVKTMKWAEIIASWLIRKG